MASGLALASQALRLAPFPPGFGRAGGATEAEPNPIRP
jgi:hypothetical protein